LAYEMLNSAQSPWKPLICNFPSSYDNFLQMQSLEELDRCSADVSKVNPGYNATRKIETEMDSSAFQLYGIVAAVVAYFPRIFPSGLPAKYFMHARMAALSRAWGSDGRPLLCPVADLVNHQAPAHAQLSLMHFAKTKGNVEVVEVVMQRTAAKEEEIYYGMPMQLHECALLQLRSEAHTTEYTPKPCIPKFIFNYGKLQFLIFRICFCNSRCFVTSYAGYAPTEAQNNSCAGEF
jgi:hypothetical protein